MSGAMPYVYVMVRSDGWHKIGVSVNPSNRRLNADVSRGLGPVRVVRKFKVDDPYAIESVAHTIAENNACREGEWFEATDKECIQAVTKAIRIYKEIGRRGTTKLRRRLRTPKPILRGRGRPIKHQWTKEQVDKAKKVWFSRDYVTNTAAARHLPKGMTARHCWGLFGASGRPYKQKHKRKAKKR